jgi:hypothetical protein
MFCQPGAAIKFNQFKREGCKSFVRRLKLKACYSTYWQDTDFAALENNSSWNVVGIERYLIQKMIYMDICRFAQNLIISY